MPTAKFGRGQIFAPAKSAYMPSLAIRNAPQPRRGQNSPKAVFINPLLGTIKTKEKLRQHAFTATLQTLTTNLPKKTPVRSKRLFTHLNQRLNTGNPSVVRPNNKGQAAVGTGLIKMHCCELITLASKLLQSHFRD